MPTTGGRVTISFNGRSRSARAEVEIMPARATADAGVNQDGTDFTTVQPKLAGANIRFDRGTMYWTEDELLQKPNVTILEIDARITHFFTDATIVGEPSINTATGEVTGLSIRTSQYRVLPS